MIFVTVGTQFSFDRLIKAIDQACESGLITDEIFAQTGQGQYQPKHFEAVASLEKDKFDTLLKQSSGVISHAGMGTITMAFDNQIPLLVMPRRKKHNEVVNDHQVAIANKFESLGLMLVAEEEKDLPGKIKQLKNFNPQQRQTQQQDVVNRVKLFLNEQAQLKFGTSPNHL